MAILTAVVVREIQARRHPGGPPAGDVGVDNAARTNPSAVPTSHAQATELFLRCGAWRTQRRAGPIRASANRGADHTRARREEMTSASAREKDCAARVRPARRLGTRVVRPASDQARHEAVTLPKHPLTGAERTNPGAPEPGPKEFDDQQGRQTQSRRHGYPGDRCAPRIEPSRKEGQRIQPEKKGMPQDGAGPRRNEQARADRGRSDPMATPRRPEAGQGVLQQPNRAHEAAKTATHRPRQQEQRQRQQGENADGACGQRATQSHERAQGRQYHHRPFGRPLRTARPPESNGRRKRAPADQPPPGSRSQVPELGCGHSTQAMSPVGVQPKKAP